MDLSNRSRVAHACRLEERDEIYVLALDRAGTEPPAHPNLAPVLATTELDGAHYWTVARPAGVPLEELIREQGAAPHLALEVTRQIGEALAQLEVLGLAPVDFYRDVRWVDGVVVLDWAGALMRDDLSFPKLEGLRPEAVRVTGLAALLHSLLSGKAATVPPSVFLPLERFTDARSQAVQDLIDVAMRGEIFPGIFIDRVSQLERDQRVAALFPGALPADDRGMQPDAAPAPDRAAAGDRLLRVVCFVVGLWVLYQYS